MFIKKIRECFRNPRPSIVQSFLFCLVRHLETVNLTQDIIWRKKGGTTYYLILSREIISMVPVISWCPYALVTIFHWSKGLLIDDHQNVFHKRRDKNPLCQTNNEVIQTEEQVIYFLNIWLDTQSNQYTEVLTGLESTCCCLADTLRHLVYDVCSLSQDTESNIFNGLLRETIAGEKTVLNVLYIKTFIYIKRMPSLIQHLVFAKHGFTKLKSMWLL